MRPSKNSASSTDRPERRPPDGVDSASPPEVLPSAMVGGQLLRVFGGDFLGENPWPQ